MPAWIFQCNPDLSDFDKYLSSTNHAYLSVTIRKYRSEMEIGDEAFIWRASGRSKAIRGIVGYGKVFETCKPTTEVDHPEYLAQIITGLPEIPDDVKAGIELSEKRLLPDDNMLTYEEIKMDNYLSEMQIIKAHVGAIFKLDDEQCSRLKQLWDTGHTTTEKFESEKYSAEEGKKRTVLHKEHERDARLVRIAKNNFKANNDGRLFCELCAFDFSEKYPEIGDGFIEAHHKKPVAQLKEDEKTVVSDLMMVCANCHRILHRGDPDKNMEYLKTLFKRT
jgi:EVE domain/HNH endonuclease